MALLKQPIFVFPSRGKFRMLSLASMPLRTAVIGLIVAFAVSGCGRKGPLEAPNASVPTNAQTSPQPAVVPIPKKSKLPEDNSKINNTPFFLDFLL